MTQMTHNNFFTMTEIGRITLPEPLSCLHSFITPIDTSTFSPSVSPHPHNYSR
ncbi:hypothetical protein J3Q64DRAFT_1773368 [Phycomyces blakesleeanus]|uniref:Uncharacterized protein n=1 Tax=Phycomyces blakesleeanus TaxID=4837 RepID=A0ABR3AM65_PHYBL